MIDIKAIRAAAEVVEWKEWKYVDYSCDAEAGVVSKGGLVALCTGHYAERDNHAKYIATANPATVIALCDEIERLKDLLGKANALCRIRADEIEGLRKEIDRLQTLCNKQVDELTKAHRLVYGPGVAEVVKGLMP